MEIGEAVGRYEQAAALLPARWQQVARRAPEHRKAMAEEFRLRTGRPMTILTCEGEMLVSDELPRDSVTQADLEQLCDAVTGYSRYAAAETMAKGYLIGRGGFRIGLCGTVAVIGSNRMEFQRLIPILNYFAIKLGQCMSGRKEEEHT